MAAQRHARGAGGRGLAGSRPDPDRRGDELRHHQRHQHGAALPHRRPRGGPTPQALQGRGHRRLPQHDAAHGRPAPHHRRQGRSLRLQGRQQQLRRSHAARARATWSAGCPCASRTAAASSPGCTPPSWPLCSWVAWPQFCSWAPSSSAAAATVAAHPTRARATPCRDPQPTVRGSSASTRRPCSPPRPWLPWPSSRSARSPSAARRPSRSRSRLRTPRRSASVTTPRRPPARSTRTAS